MIEGSTFSFEEGKSLGLLHHVWETESHGAFMSKVADYARSFCKPGRATLAVGAIKRAVVSGLEVPLEQGLALERELQAELFASADAKEGLAAHQQKRKPQFEGR
jgi:enoyl-CoA hydratase/carnithine racemase